MPEYLFKLFHLSHKENLFKIIKSSNRSIFFIVEDLWKVDCHEEGINTKHNIKGGDDSFLTVLILFFVFFDVSPFVCVYVFRVLFFI